jgi:hypothetical protein
MTLSNSPEEAPILLAGKRPPVIYPQGHVLLLRGVIDRASEAFVSAATACRP